ncbi:hypothetical protein GXM_10098 [Nostoc sphaeroides CCNUC1]|uniref:Uncharacterized protein n=1 Tax=Nostoc sphaeroides CCNUC1 TaxID=2653204 RepID=A0A5P8WJD9_9NOSO|nr:hypothetical protein GXM_10098 [Nostoc sphaeroides CCNUC1]
MHLIEKLDKTSIFPILTNYIQHLPISRQYLPNLQFFLTFLHLLHHPLTKFSLAQKFPINPNNSQDLLEVSHYFPIIGQLP